MTLTILVILGAAIYLDMGLGAMVMLLGAMPPRTVRAFAIVLVWPVALAAVMPSLAIMARRRKC